MNLSGKLMMLENTILNEKPRPRKTNATCFSCLWILIQGIHI